MGFVGERKALAAAVLAFYMLYFLLAALVMPPEDGFRPFLATMGGMYGTAFFALVAGYFWARWFAIGVGIYGLITGILALWQIGPVPEILFYTGTHGFISLALWGNRMAGDFDGRDEWRGRFHLDEHGTRRLGKSVIRVGIGLPVLIAYGLAPRGMAEMALVAAVLGLAGIGIWGLLRMRTWGLLLMIAAGLSVFVTVGTTEQIVTLGRGSTVNLMFDGIMGGALLLFAALPFGGPMIRYLRS